MALALASAGPVDKLCINHGTAELTTLLGHYPAH